MTKFSKSSIIYSIEKEGVEIDMLDDMKQDMRESLRLIDSLYIELITDGLRSDGAKNKLISMYERIIKINVTVVNESISKEDFAGQLIEYYCDLCNAMVCLFEYYRKLNNKGTVSDVDLVRDLEARMNVLNERIEYLENRRHSGLWCCHCRWLCKCDWKLR